MIDPASGTKATFISAEDLIAAKLASGRPQDLTDVDAIQKAQGVNPGKKKKTRTPREL